MSEAVYMLTSDQIDQIAQRMCDMIEERKNKSQIESIYRKKTCSKSEAARHMKASRATIYNMIADGRLKANSSGKILVQSIIEYEGLNQNVKLNKRGNKVYV